MSSNLQALSELTSRYAKIFRRAWRVRKQLDTQSRLPHEAHFLPASLALQETPVSPAPRVFMWLIITFAGLAVLWASFGKIDIVASAPGKIVPNDRTKVIQPAETAVVKKIYVMDGQQVKRGELLLELDTTATTADIIKTREALTAAQLDAARSTALIKALESGRQPVINPAPNFPVNIQAEAQLLVSGQYSEMQSKLAALDADTMKRRAELQTTREIVSKLVQTSPIAARRAEDFKRLTEQNFVSQHAYLERDQIRIEQAGDLATQKSRVVELQAAIDANIAQRNLMRAEFRRSILTTLNEATQKADSLQQELIKADQRGRLMRLTAPVDGTVQQLAMHTIGGVVTPAQAIMVIVPRDNLLEIEALVENKDIGFVNPGQVAEVKVETFPFTKYGTIDAKVISVSNDAIQDEKRGLVYHAKVLMKRATISVEGKQVNLSPGMAVTVEIKTGQRRVIDYFLSPLMQYSNESLRER